MSATATLDAPRARAYPARSTTAGAKPMGKVTISIPLITWRDGRPRFIPGKQARHEGWTGEDLRHGATGPWYSLDEAIAWSEQRQQDMADKRQAALESAAKAAAPAPRRPISNSVGHVFAAWQKSPPFQSKVWTDGRKRRKPLGRKTIHFYNYNSGIFQDRFPDVWASPVAALTPSVVDGMFEILEQERGLSTARAVIATLRVALSFARRKGMINDNPAKDLALPMAQPRVRAASITEIQSLINTADAIGRPDLGDMVLFATVTGQRQGDRISMIADQIAQDRVTLRQSKRGKLISVKIVPALARRLMAAMQRRSAQTVQCPQLMIDEANNAPWTSDRYSKTFARLRKQAVAGVADEAGNWISPPCETLADLTDQDLKDTNQTWLANASATDVEMAAIAGHSEATAANTRKHYVAINAKQSDNAIDKLEIWLAAEGAKF
jgi:hypothetical protein